MQLLRYFLALLWESLLKVQLDFTLWRGLCTLSRNVFRRCLLHYNLDNDGSYDASSCNLHYFTLALSSCKEKGEQRFSSLCFLVLPLADTSDSLTWNSSGFSNFGEDRQYTELPPQDTRSQWEVGVLRPGSYCTYRYYPLQREQREGEWNPKASKGILVRKGTTTWFYGEEIKLMYVNFQIKVLSVFLSTTHLSWVCNSNVFPGALLGSSPIQAWIFLVFSQLLKLLSNLYSENLLYSVLKSRPLTLTLSIALGVFVAFLSRSEELG